jgi:putative ABC transport system permease protein
MNLRRRMEKDLGRDLREHIELATQENFERGMAPAEARLAALRKFGNVTRAMEDTYAVWHWMALDRLRQDLRYAGRTLLRNPGFAAVAVLTLALAIGMTTAVFSVVNAILLRPPPYPDAARLVWVANRIDRLKMEAVAGPDFFEWKDRARSIDRMASYTYSGRTLGGGAESEQIGVAAVTEDFLPLVGARAEAGRLLTSKERGLLLTHRLFMRRFAGSPATIGKTVLLDGRPYTIAGVLPESFRFDLPLDSGEATRDIEALVPDQMTRESQTRGGRMSILNVIARLRPGVRTGQAFAELDAIQRNVWREDRSGFYGSMRLVVMPLQDRMVSGSRRALLVLLAAVGCVLLIGCVNVANLLLARSTARRREIALRSAIGAGRGGVIAQLVAEGLVLALAGGVCGLLVAHLALAAIIRMGANAVPRLAEAGLDPAALAFTLAISCATGVLFGLGPALALSRPRLADVLKEGSRTLSDGAAALGSRRLLMAAEVAVAVVLLTGAGLLLRSFWRMNARPAGFASERTAVMLVTLGGAARVDELLSRVCGLPGVEACGISNARMRGFLAAEGVEFPPNQAPQTVFHTVSAGYFRAMGMRLAAGRWLSDRENELVVMVNEAFARRVFGTRDAVGRRIRTGSAGLVVSQPGAPATPNGMASIVGVVADLRYTALDQEPGPETYLPYRQSSSLRGMDVVVRASGDATPVAGAASKAIASIDPAQAVYDVRTLEQALADSIAPRRFNLLLLGGFAGAALLLAVVGIYGVMSYAVTQRTHEVGVRMALGAGRRQVVRMIVRQGLLVAAAGLAAGLAASLGLARLIRGMLYEVGPADPWTFAGVCAVLAVAVWAACWIPARRAAAVDPMVALRYE